jgi:hypothetical protein
LEWLEEAGVKTPPENPLPATSAAARVFQADAANLVHGLVALSIGGVIAVPTHTLYGDPPPPPGNTHTTLCSHY